jgi:splicing factor 3B subunit 1
VQENCIDLVGRIADRGAEHVPAREWMRICFELLDMLKAHKKAIRRATVNTFGYIAKAIGPQDVLVTLLNNLKVQERQNRVCTTVAIAIVAETCAPFTVLPALMNEYRVPELNVQNGVLKALSFMFEYIGEMGKDYIYAVTPLLQVRQGWAEHLTVVCLAKGDALLLAKMVLGLRLPLHGLAHGDLRLVSMSCIPRCC